MNGKKTVPVEILLYSNQKMLRPINPCRFSGRKKKFQFHLERGDLLILPKPNN
jgi:hypothetical protein